MQRAFRIQWNELPAFFVACLIHRVRDSQSHQTFIANLPARVGLAQREATPATLTPSPQPWCSAAPPRRRYARACHRSVGQRAAADPRRHSPAPGTRRKRHRQTRHQPAPLPRRNRAHHRLAHRRHHPRNAPSNAATALAADASTATSSAAGSARNNRVPDASPALTFTSASALRRVSPPNFPFSSNCGCCFCYAIYQIESKWMRRQLNKREERGEMQKGSEHSRVSSSHDCGRTFGQASLPNGGCAPWSNSRSGSGQAAEAEFDFDFDLDAEVLQRK
jgi:hypothetical protein